MSVLLLRCLLPSLTIINAPGTKKKKNKKRAAAVSLTDDSSGWWWWGKLIIILKGKRKKKHEKKGMNFIYFTRRVRTTSKEAIYTARGYISATAATHH